MKNQRLTSPVKQDYIDAIGRAAYLFSSLEWQVVHCANKIKPGIIHKITGDEMTAGKIAKTFKDLVNNMPRSKQRDELAVLAEQFMKLKDVRNGIIHGKPCTGPNGEPRLWYDKILEINDLEKAADDFAECGSKLNAMFYGFLSEHNKTNQLNEETST